MKIIYCVVGITLLISSIYMSYLKKDENIFKKFVETLDEEQSIKYREIVNERLMIYSMGMILGLLIGLYYFFNNKNDSYRFCKFLFIIYMIKLGFYYFYPKQPLMLYSLNTKEQTDAWADIYTEMKNRWKYSLLFGFVGYLVINEFIR